MSMTNSTNTINNRVHHLWRACWARIRKLLLRDVKLTQIPHMQRRQDLGRVPWTSKTEFSIPPSEARAIARPWPQARDCNANNNGGQLQRRLSQSPWLLFFKSHPVTSCFFIPLTHTHTHTHTHTNRIKSPDAQCPHSCRLETIQRESETVSDNLRNCRWGDKWHREGKKMKNWKHRCKIIWYMNETHNESHESSWKKKLASA